MPLGDYEAVIEANQISAMYSWQSKLEKLIFKDMGASSSMGVRKWVDVTHIRNPSSFYVRPCIYSEFLPALQVDTGKKATELSKQSVVLFKSTLHSWVRGYILKKNKRAESYVIFAMDYGFTEKSVQTSDIHEICCSYVLRVPPLAVWCSLTQCQPKEKYWSDSAINMFKEHVDMLPCHVILHETSCSRAQYVEFILPTQIGKILVMFGVSTAVVGSNLFVAIKKPFTKQLYYRHPKLTSYHSYHVILTHKVNDRIFFVTLVNDYEKFCKRKAEFLKFANTLPVLDFFRLKKNLPVCYLTSKEANHAVVEYIDRTIDKAILRIMDDGKTIEIEESTMGEAVRALDENYLKLVRAQVKAYFCQSYTEIMVTLTPGQQYKMKVHTLGQKFDSPYEVSIDNVVEDTSKN